MSLVAARRSTILVSHPDPLLRAGLVSALRERAAFETLVEDVDGVIPDRPRIDVVITDHDSALRLAADSARPARGALAAARILVLATTDREADIRRAIEAGIHGYIMLGGPLDELIEGATTVANGLRYVCRAAARRMADSLTRTPLTTREIEVLSLVVAGESNKAIARELRIEVGTVKSHMTAIMTKLGATSRTQAASIAAVRGLVAHPSFSTSPAFAAMPATGAPPASTTAAARTTFAATSRRARAAALPAVQAPSHANRPVP
jgi:DNA-binding NarL/FixJ family response regulator